MNEHNGNMPYIKDSAARRIYRGLKRKISTFGLGTKATRNDLRYESRLRNYYHKRSLIGTLLEGFVLIVLTAAIFVGLNILTNDTRISGIIAAGFFVVILILYELWIVGAKPTRATKYYMNMRRGFKNVDLKRFQKKIQRTNPEGNSQSQNRKAQQKTVKAKEQKRTTFFCQLDNTQHPKTDSSYQCKKCSRMICRECHKNIVDVGVSKCPFCNGKFTKVQ